MNWLKKNIWLLASLTIAILAGRMLLSTHHFYVHDDIQVFRVNEFKECIKDGQIPCRWSKDLGKGYGMPWFNFYPPMIYLVPSILSLTGLSIITSLNIFMFLTFIIAAWGMFCLIKELTDRSDLAFFGSVLFTLYPFHATNVFLRGVYAENLVWSLAPWVLYLIYKQSKTGKFNKYLPLLFASIFLTHVISSFLIIATSILWLMILDFKKWRMLMVQLLIGLGISAFFFGPAMLEKNLVQSSSLIEGYYSYLNHFVTLKQLFINYTWNYGASYWDTPSVEMGYMVGHVHILLLAILLAIVVYFKPKSKLRNIAVLSSILFAAVLFMTHNKSVLIWKALPSLAYVQFPWRFVGWAGIPLVIAISSLFSMIPVKLSKFLMYFAIPIIIIYSYPFFFPRGYDQYQDSDFISGQFRVEQQTKALFDYLPNTVHVVPEKGVGTFYFPGWVSAKPLEIDPDSGVILNPPSDLKWQETPLRLLFDVISILSISGYLIYLMYNKAYGKIH
jgi:uncharacterized membrane protein